MSITANIIELLSSKHMTARQLHQALDCKYEMESIHCVLNTLKKRDCLIVVGKLTELSATNRKRPSSIYSYKPPIKEVRVYEPKRSRYRADLSKAIKHKDRYKELLLKKNYLFMMYAKELGLKYDTN